MQSWILRGILSPWSDNLQKRHRPQPIQVALNRMWRGSSEKGYTTKGQSESGNRDNGFEFCANYSNSPNWIFRQILLWGFQQRTLQNLCSLFHQARDPYILLSQHHACTMELVNCRKSLQLWEAKPRVNNSVNVNASRDHIKHMPLTELCMALTSFTSRSLKDPVFWVFFETFEKTWRYQRPLHRP